MPKRSKAQFRSAGKSTPAVTASPARAGRAVFPRIAVVVSNYSLSITQMLLEGALDAYARHYFPESGSGKSKGPVHPRVADHVDVYHTPGSFEVLSIAAAAAATGRYDGVVALGCIIRGETSHDHHLATAVTTGLAELSIRGGPDGGPMPVGLGVLTVNTPRQALARAGGKHGNKGEEAMNAVLWTIATLDRVRGGGSDGRADAGLLPSGRGPPDKARERS